MSLTNLNEAVKALKKEEIDAFLSRIIHIQTTTMFLGSSMHIMTQTLERGDRHCLPHGLSILNTYTTMTTGSKQVAVIVKNLPTAPITINKGVNITWVMTVNAIPQVRVVPGILEKLDKIKGVQRAKMSVEQRRKALFQ